MTADYPRLAVATAVVLLPGLLLARAFGQRGAAAVLAWGTAAIFVAWAVVFTVHGTITLALEVLAAIGVVALVAGIRRPVRLRLPGAGEIVFLGGAGLGIALWHVAGIVTGDGLFHLARVRKLTDLHNLHLRSVDELAGGGLHPGYAFPLWHGFLALVAKVSGLDPAVVVNHEASLLVPIACLVAYEAGVAVFESPWAGVAVLVGSLALYCFAAGHGGSYVALALPGTAARQLFVPAAIALFFTGDLATIAVVFGALTLIHPTYAFFALIPLVAYAIVRAGEWRRSAVALAAACVPAGLVYLWLRPLVSETLSENPGPAEVRRALRLYSGELVVSSVHSYRLAAEVLSRTGAVAVAALVLVPLAGFAAKRRWGAFVLGGSVSVLLLVLVPPLFVHFSNAVSLSQSRRAAGFVPLPFAFAGGLALVTRRIVLAPLALVAGIALQHEWPGDFAYGLKHGGPAIAAWIALAGGGVALAVGLVRRSSAREAWVPGAVAAVLFVVPVAVHAARTWTPAVTTDRYALSPAIIAELKQVPPQAVVIATPQVSYHLVAAAPVYVVDAPPNNVANTRANRPYERVKEVEAWLTGRAPGVPAKYGATWAVRKGRLYRLSS